MAELLRATVEPAEVVADLEGRPVVVTVRVFNLSTIVDGYRIDVPAAPPWLAVEPGEVRLLPGTDEEVEVRLSVRDADRVPAHDVDLRLRVRSVANPDVARGVRVNVRLPAVDAQVALLLEPEMLRGEQAVSRLTAHNQLGNVPVQLRLRGSDPEGVVGFAFRPQTLRMEPGQHATAEMRVRAPRPRDGAPVHRQLTVTATDGRRTFSTSGTLVQRPPEQPEPFPIRPVLRMLLTVVGAGLLFIGTFAPWTQRRAGSDLTVSRFCAAVGDQFGLECRLLPDLAVPSLLISAGLVTLVLAAMALLGIVGNGGLSRFAGIAAIVYVLVIVFVLTIGGAGFGVHLGVVMILVGGVCAFAGGALAH